MEVNKDGHLNSREGFMECDQMVVCALLGLRSRRVLPKPDKNARLVRNDIRAEVEVRTDDKNREVVPQEVRGLPSLMLV